MVLLKLVFLYTTSIFGTTSDGTLMMDSKELVNRINEINDTTKARPVKTSGPVKKSNSKTGTSTKSVNRRKQNTARPNGAAQKKTTVKSGVKRKRPKRRSSFGDWIDIRHVIAAIVVLLLAIGGISYAVWYNSFENITLSDYSEVTLSGYDHYGIAEVKIAGDPSLADFFKTVEASLDKDNDLSNGDEIVVAYSYDEAAAKESKLRINGDSVALVVDGLMEAEVITKNDLFENVTVSLEGIAPCVSVLIENANEREPYCNIEYALDGEKEFFDIGDTVRVKANILPEDANNHAYDFSQNPDDYYLEMTVPSGDRYISEPEQITPEMLAEMEKVGFKLISESNAKEYGLRIFQGEARLKPVFVGNSTTFQWANPYVISAYFHSVTDKGKAMLETHPNDVQLVYGVTLTQADGTSCLTEMVIQFKDIIEKADGSVDLNLDSGRIVSVSHKDKNIKSLVTDDGNGLYRAEKLTE